MRQQNWLALTCDCVPVGFHIIPPYMHLCSHSSFFSKGGCDVNELQTHFIMTSNIMELTSTISEQASALGVKHLREDKLITTLWSKPRPFHGVQGPRLNPAVCPPRCLHPKESEVRWTSSLVLNAGLLKRCLGSLGRRGSSTNLFVVGLVDKSYRLDWRLLPASGWARGSVSHWTVKQRGISLIQVPMIKPDAPKERKDSQGARSMTYWPFPAVWEKSQHNLISESGEYVKAVYCHPAYLTSMQSTS